MQIPASLTDADTRSGFRQVTLPGMVSKYEYYYLPTKNYFQRIGCPSDVVDDLTHTALAKLPQIIDKYDVAKGAFRPYYKQSIRNVYRDYLRNNTGKIASRTTPIPDTDNPAGDDEDSIDMDLLRARAREVVDWFLRDCSDLKVMKGMEILQRWVVGGERLEVIARDPHIDCSTRYARRLHRRASDEFGTWLKKRFDPDEWARLLTYGQRVMPTVCARMADDSNALTNLFRWMSERKRMTIMAFLLMLFTSLPPAEKNTGESDE